MPRQTTVRYVRVTRRERERGEGGKRGGGGTHRNEFAAPRASPAREGLHHKLAGEGNVPPRNHATAKKTHKCDTAGGREQVCCFRQLCTATPTPTHKPSGTQSKKKKKHFRQTVFLFVLSFFLAARMQSHPNRAALQLLLLYLCFRVLGGTTDVLIASYRRALKLEVDPSGSRGQGVVVLG